MKTKQELIKTIVGMFGYRMTPPIAERIVNVIDAEGWLRDPGEPIDPEDIRKGDRVRIEYSDGEARELVTEGSMDGAEGEFFLLDRPKPELPTAPGSVVKLKGGYNYTLGRDGMWRDSTTVQRPELLSEFDWEVVA